MDEFEMFRARAYGGGLGTPEATPGRGEDSSMMAAVRSRSKRRHSSVGICRSDADPYVPFGTVPVVNSCDSKRPEVVKTSEEFSSDRWKDKPKLTSQVTVAIEPPSPTENQYDEYGNRLQRTPRRHPNNKTQLNDDDDDDYNDKVEDRVVDDVHTGEHAKTPSPRRHRRGQETEHHLDAINTTLDVADDDPNVLGSTEDQPDLHRGRSSSVKRGRHAPSLSVEHTDRPARLRLSPGRSTDRRKSVTSGMESLQLTQPSPSNARRNSYTGTTLSLKPTSPPPTFNTGRRGSAITYLSDLPATGPNWKQPSPAGSPMRRKSCFEDLGRGGVSRCGSGGLNAEEIKAHLEELTRAAARATAGGSKGTSRASSVSRGTANRYSVCASESDSTAASDSSDRPQIYRVMVVGSQGVGKTTLTDQLMTSEYLANKENHQDHLDEEHVVSVRLDDEVAKVYIFETSADESLRDPSSADVDAYLVIYSVTDRLSFSFAQSCIQNLGRGAEWSQPVIVLVANKQDLVRNRAVSASEGKRLGSKRRSKFLEVSALLDHKVDEVLVTIIRECRSRQRKIGSEIFGTEISDELGCLRRILDICRKLCK